VNAPAAAPIAVVVMGVSGCSKSSVGAALAQRLDARFLDADDFHPPANVEKMRAGIPLDDTDRAPWLARLNAAMRAALDDRASVVLACSALKARYRAALAVGIPTLRVVHLTGSFELIESRIAARSHRYMPASLLASQFAALEAPEHAVVLEIDRDVETLAAAAERALRG
ncbi:MAG: gluconokinase, partial [Burkholderiaceae bacterium]